MLYRLQSLWASPAFTWIRLSLSVALAVVCGTSSALLWQQRETWDEQITLPLQDPLANLNQLGINAALEQYDVERLGDVLAQMEAAGIRWVRQRFGWDQIEPQRGELEWERWDAVVKACAAHDLQIIAVLDGSPAWARPDHLPAAAPLAPPQEVSDWGAFVARVAERYRGQIAAYQLWDEPNLTGHWGNQYVDPVAYVSLLREGTVRIRDTDPAAAVLLAALAPTVEMGPLNLNEIDYVRQVIEAGGAPFFDVVALQPYGFGQAPDAKADPGLLNFRRVELVRRELVRHGLADRPVWATAWGWNHLPAEWEGDPSPWPSVTQNQQVAYTTDGIILARREWPWMGPMILYAWQPDVSATNPRWGFALLDAQGTPGPLYERLAEYNAARNPLRAGLYTPTPDNVQTTGDWRFSDAGADPPRGADAQQQNATLSFDVRATALDLTVRRGDFWGVLYVSVDGGPATGLPRDEEGRSYLVLHDPAGQVETVTVARGLSTRGPHHIRIVAHGGWGQWPLVSWTVYDEQRPPPDPISIWLFGLLAIGGALMAGGQIALVPQLRQPIYGTIGRVFRWYRALPEWIPIVVTLGTALAFYIIPWTAVALPLLALLFLLIFLRIDLGLATVALALPFYTQPKALLGRPFSIVELSLALCTGAWLLARLLDLGRALARSGPQPALLWLRQLDLYLLGLPRHLWQRWTWLDKGMLALLLLAALSLGWTTHLEVAQREFRTVFLESAVFYALVRLAVRSPRAHQRVIEGWLLGALAISGIGIWQLVAGQNLITAEGVWRVRGLYGSPNNLALYLERAFPVLLAIAWQGRNRAARVVYALAAIPISAALVMTLSKGALLIGVPASLLALGLVQRDRRALWVAMVAVAAVALVMVPFAFTERFQSILNLRAGTAFFRLKLWRSTLSMIGDHPLTGVGMDNFLYYYRSRYVLPSAWGELDLSHPHNLILDAWTRLGIGGVVVIAWLCTAFFRSVWGQLQTALADRRALLLGLLASMVAVLAHGMVDHAVFLIDLAFIFALLLAMGSPRRSTRE
jgi:O-antigen ligase